MDQLYTGSGNDDTLQFNTTSSLTFALTVWSDMDSNVGGPALSNTIILSNCLGHGYNCISYIQHVQVYLPVVDQHNKYNFFHPIQ